MFLFLSGEGPSDIGISNDEVGPMSKLLDNWISIRSGYSLLETEQYLIIPKQQLIEKAKIIRPRSSRGKKQQVETKFYFKNAQALALLAKEKNKDNSIVILFRDSDGTASVDRGEWQAKNNSMLDGFSVGGFSRGVPMIPKPKSESWALCALKNNYQHCSRFEGRSGNDKSPKSLKAELEKCLREPATRIVLNQKIDAGKFAIENIIDMESMTAFKDRLDDVLDQLNLQAR